MPPKKKRVAASSCAPSEVVGTSPLAPVVQQVSNAGKTVTCSQWEATCCARGTQRWQWVVHPRPLDGTDAGRCSFMIPSANEIGCCVFLPRSVVTVYQDQKLSFFALLTAANSGGDATSVSTCAELQPFASFFVGHIQMPMHLIGSCYLLLQPEDADAAERELRVYDVAGIHPGAASSALLKKPKAITWASGNLQTVRRRTRQSIIEPVAEETSSSGSDADARIATSDKFFRRCHQHLVPRRLQMPPSTRAYPNWGVRCHAGGFLATIPAADETWGRYGAPHCNVYRLPVEESDDVVPHRVADIPTALDDVLDVLLRTSPLSTSTCVVYVCIIYRNLVPHFWNLTRGRRIDYPSDDIISLFRDVLGEAFPCAADWHLLEAAARGDLQRVKTAVEEGANLLRRDFDASVAASVVLSSSGHAEGESSSSHLIREHLRCGWSSTSNGPTALHYAVYCGSLAVIKYLLYTGVRFFHSPRQLFTRDSQPTAQRRQCRFELLHQCVKRPVHHALHALTTNKSSVGDVLQLIDEVKSANIQTPALCELMKQVLGRAIARSEGQFQDGTLLNSDASADEAESDAVAAEAQLATAAAQIRREAAMTALFNVVDLNRNDAAGICAKRPRAANPAASAKVLDGLLAEAFAAGCELRWDVLPVSRTECGLSGQSSPLPLLHTAIVTHNVAAVKGILKSKHMFPPGDDEDRFDFLLDSESHGIASPVELAAIHKNSLLADALAPYLPDYSLAFEQAALIGDVEGIKRIYDNTCVLSSPSQRRIECRLLHFSLHGAAPLVLACRQKNLSAAKHLVEWGCSLRKTHTGATNCGIVELHRAFYSVDQNTTDWLSAVAQSIVCAGAPASVGDSASAVFAAEAARANAAVFHRDAAGLRLEFDRLSTRCREWLFACDYHGVMQHSLLYTAVVEARSLLAAQFLLEQGHPARCVVKEQPHIRTESDELSSRTIVVSSLYAFLTQYGRNVFPATAGSDGSESSAATLEQFMSLLANYRCADELLIEAVRSSNIVRVKELLLAKANPNTISFDTQQSGFTPLHFALHLRHDAKVAICELLLNAGGDPTIADALVHRRPIENVSPFTDPELYLLILRHCDPAAHASLLAATHDDIAALYSAIRRGSVSVVSAWLERLKQQSIDFHAVLSAQIVPIHSITYRNQVVPLSSGTNASGLVQRHAVDPLAFATQLFFNATGGVGCDDAFDSTEIDNVVLGMRNEQQLAGRQSAESEAPRQQRAMWKYLLAIALLVDYGAETDLIQKHQWSHLTGLHKVYWDLRSARRTHLSASPPCVERRAMSIAKTAIFCMKVCHAVTTGLLPTLQALYMLHGEAPTAYPSLLRCHEGLGGCTSLLDAAIRSDKVEIVRWLIATEPSWPDGSWSGYAPSLDMWAVAVECNLSPKSQSESDVSGTCHVRLLDAQLMLAVSRSDNSEVRRLVEEKGADVNFDSGPNDTPSPLRLAVARRCTVDVVRLLLSLGADPDRKSHRDATSAVQACEAALGYSFDNSRHLVHIYCMLTNALRNSASGSVSGVAAADGQHLERLLVNYEVREKLTYLLTSEPSPDFLKLLQHPLLLPTSTWEACLIACGVQRRRSGGPFHTLASLRITSGPLLDMTAVMHPALLAAVLDLPGVSVSQTLRKHILQSKPQHAAILDATSSAERRDEVAKVRDGAASGVPLI